MTTGKTIALTRQTFVGRVMSLLFNMLSRLVITFLPRSKCPLISDYSSPNSMKPTHSTLFLVYAGTHTHLHTLRHTHTHTHTRFQAQGSILHPLNYPAIPALSPFPGSCSKAQTLLITYPKSILYTTTVAILSRSTVRPAKICSVPNPFAARSGHETHFLSWDITQRKSARELRKVFALVTQALLSLPRAFLLCPFSFPSFFFLPGPQIEGLR